MENEHFQIAQLMKEVEELARRFTEFQVLEKYSEHENKLISIIFDQFPMGIFLLQDGIILYVNNYFREIIGYCQEELTGRMFLDLISPEYRAITEENITKMLTGEHNTPCECKLMIKSGEHRWILGRATIIKYREKEAMLGCFVDITQQKLIEEALKDSEKKWQMMCDASL